MENRLIAHDSLVRVVEPSASLSFFRRPAIAFILTSALALGAWHFGSAALFGPASATTGTPIAETITTLKENRSGRADRFAQKAPEKFVATAPDFVREAWARKAAERKQEASIAGAFDTRFLKAKPGKITGAEFAALVKAANEPKPAVVEEAETEEAPVLLASLGDAAKPGAVRAMEEALSEDHAVEEDEPAVAALGEDLPDDGIIPGWRPKLATRAAEPIAPAEKPERAPVAALAFARPDNPVERPAAKSAAIPWPGLGRKTAIYDISGAVVYLPNGTKLEAHSGRGAMRDNPKFTHVKMRGSTPASTYKLSMRERRFHGVEAIRLNPIDGKAPLGRTGLLAHTYLLRVPGDSSGCIVFKDYDKFLNAFKRGEITHIVVVPNMQGAPNSPSIGARVASLFSSNR